jgi:hypothetical protein
VKASLGGFGVACVLLASYPTGIARCFRPFVDLLLTRREDSKKPHHLAGRKALIRIAKFGCGGRMPTMVAFQRKGLTSGRQTDRDNRIKHVRSLSDFA